MFFIEMGKLGYRKREPNEPPKETPNRLRQMVEYHQNVLDYSEKDMASLLCLTPQEFHFMYRPEPPKKPHLRLVN